MSTASAQDWFKGQQQYWDSWFDQQRKFFNAAPTASSGFQGPQGQWAELLKVWQGAVSGTGQNAPDLAAFQQQFTKAGETYLNMMQQFYQGTGQAKPLEQMTKEWAENLQKLFTGGAQGSFAANGFSAGGFPKDPMSAIDPMNFFASFPGIGYTREKQEQLSHLYQQWSEFEAKFRDYNNGMTKVGLEAIQKFQAYVASPPSGTEPLSSLKEVYAKWVDICEEIYAKYAMTEEYTTGYGEVVNALMTFKKQQNKMLDDAMDQMNLPTRAEVDSLHERLHALRREVAALKADLKPKAPKAKPEATTKQGKKS